MMLCEGVKGGEGTYVGATAGLADLVLVAADDDVGAERVAGAVGDVGLGTYVLAVLVLHLGMGAGRGRGQEEERVGLHRDQHWIGVRVSECKVGLMLSTT